MKRASFPRRQTRQRAAIRAVLETASRPLSIAEILALAQRAVPGLGIATVYRTVGALVEEGVLAPVAIGGEAPRYEVGGRGHHHHFRCRRCARVFEVEGCLPEIQRLAPPDFLVEDHDIVLSGLCPECGARRRR